MSVFFAKFIDGTRAMNGICAGQLLGTEGCYEGCFSGIGDGGCKFDFSKSEPESELKAQAEE